MKKQTRYPVLGVLFLSLIFLGNAQCEGQENHSKLVTIPLRFVDAKDILNVVGNLLADESLRMDIVERQNLLVAYGSPDALAKLKDLVAMLDDDKSPRQDEMQVKVYRVANAVAADVAEVLNELVVGDKNSQTRIAHHIPSNSVIVSGESGYLEVLEELVVRLDVADENDPRTSLDPENIVVRVTWLVDDTELDETISKSLQSPNASLKELTDGLLQSGSMKNARTVTKMQTSVQVEPARQGSSKFNNSSSRKLGGKTHVMEANGRVRRVANGKYELDISLNLAKEQVNLSVGSTVTLPKNHPVAFSLSDVGDFKSAAVIEVLDAK